MPFMSALSYHQEAEWSLSSAGVKALPEKPTLAPDIPETMCKAGASETGQCTGQITGVRVE